MKYYIATALTRALDHQLLRKALHSLGHELSYDWTGHGNVKSESKERLREVATRELQGIAESDFVLVLLPGGYGTHVELGFALASGKKVFLHSEDPSLFELGPQTNAFYHHLDVISFSCPLENCAALVHSLLECPAAL
jgi:nucleoside 2-deoxyribosyltransferase